MPLVIWGVVAVAGVFGLGYAADKTGAAAEASTNLVKWGVVAGGLYIAYRVAKTGGAIK